MAATLNWRGMGWQGIENQFVIMRNERHGCDLMHAIALRQLHDNEPWKAQKRYISKAAWEQLKDYSFYDVVTRRLHESHRAAVNTLTALNMFGDKRFQAYGRRIAVLAARRIQAAKGRELTAKVTKAFDKAVKDYGVITPWRAREILNQLAPIRHTPVVSIMSKLRKENARLKKENARLNKENAKLKRELASPAVKRRRKAA